MKRVTCILLLLSASVIMQAQVVSLGMGMATAFATKVSDCPVAIPPQGFLQCPVIPTDGSQPFLALSVVGFNNGQPFAVLSQGPQGQQGPPGAPGQSMPQSFTLTCQASSGSIPKGFTAKCTWQ